MKKTVTVAASPLMTQYNAMKAELPGILLCMRLGDFYEFFGDDAAIAAGVLNIALTRRGEIAMSGFPYHVFDQSTKALVAAGHRVAVAEVVPTPKEPYNRAVTAVYPPPAPLVFIQPCLLPLPRPQRATPEARRACLVKRLERVAAILEARDEENPVVGLRTLKDPETGEFDVYPEVRLDRALTKLEKWLRVVECFMADRDPDAPEPAKGWIAGMGQFTCPIGDLRRAWIAIHGPSPRNSYIAQHGRPIVHEPAAKRRYK